LIGKLVKILTILCPFIRVEQLITEINCNRSWTDLTIVLSWDKSRSHNVFDRLYANKNAVAAKLGETLLWDKLDWRKSCRIKTFPLETMEWKRWIGGANCKIRSSIKWIG
jgi:hypothetical protein